MGGVPRGAPPDGGGSAGLIAGSIVLGFALLWVWSLVQGGAMGPVAYVGERFGRRPVSTSSSRSRRGSAPTEVGRVGDAPVSDGQKILSPDFPDDGVSGELPAWRRNIRGILVVLLLVGAIAVVG